MRHSAIFLLVPCSAVLHLLPPAAAHALVGRSPALRLRGGGSRGDGDGTMMMKPLLNALKSDAAAKVMCARAQTHSHARAHARARTQRWMRRLRWAS